MTPGLAAAIERVRADNPPPLTLKDHGLALAALGECLDEIDKQRQQEAAAPAA
jgi:hypothetical protein